HSIHSIGAIQSGLSSFENFYPFNLVDRKKIQIEVIRVNRWIINRNAINQKQQIAGRTSAKACSEIGAEVVVSSTNGSAHHSVQHLAERSPAASLELYAIDNGHNLSCFGLLARILVRGHDHLVQNSACTVFLCMKCAANYDSSHYKKSPFHRNEKFFSDCFRKK